MSLDRSARRRAAGSTLLLVVALVLAACGSATVSVAPSVAALPSATPTATPIPTPSPTPVDVSAAFVKVMVTPGFSAKAAISGTMTVGALNGDIAGTAVFTGTDSDTTMTIKVGAFTQETQSIHVGDSSWSWKSPGPWLEDPKKPAGATDDSLAAIMRSLVSVTDLGVETRDGRQLHHLRPSSGGEISGTAFGLDAATAKDAKFTLDFYATDDGTPAVMAIAGSWTQGTGEAAVATTMTFDIAFSDIGKPQSIAPPDDVWVRYTSKDKGYTIAHPADWTVKSKKSEDTYSVDGQDYVYVDVEPYKGSTAKYVTAVKAASATALGKPASETPTTLGGKPAVRLIYEFTNDSGQDVTIVGDVISRDGTGWQVDLVTAGGPEDVTVFDQFVATFAFTE